MFEQIQREGIFLSKKQGNKQTIGKVVQSGVQMY